MALTDIKIKKEKPRDKAFKLSDGEGLFLLITPRDQNIGGSNIASAAKKNYWRSGSMIKSHLLMQESNEMKREICWQKELIPA